MKSVSNLRSALLALLTISFITVFSTGCGDSNRDSFVATGFNPGANTGNLIFQLQQQATPQTIVPTGTTSVRIELFSSLTQETATLVEFQVFPFAETIVYEQVPSNVVSARITSFNSDGLPTSVSSGPVEVVLGANSEVVLETVTAVEFTALSVTPDPATLVVGNFGANTTDSQQLTIEGTINGSVFQLPVNADAVDFSLANSSVANVSADGLLSAAFNSGNLRSNTTLTTTYTFLGQEQTATTQVQKFFYEPGAVGQPAVAIGDTYEGGFLALFVNSSSNLVGVSELTFALESPVTGVTIDSQTGIITADNTAVNGTTFNVVVTFVDDGTGGTGLTFTDTVEFEVVTAVIDM